MTAIHPAPIVHVEPLYLPKDAAAAYLAMSVSTFEALGRKDDAFPRPRKLSAGRVGYLLAELRTWGHTRPVSDLPPPPNTGAGKRRTRPATAPRGPAGDAAARPGG